MKYIIISILIVLFTINLYSQTCSGTTILTLASGSIEDGSGSNDYSNNLDCNWLIQPPNATAVKFLFFDTQLINQGGDTISVYDGINEQGTLLIKVSLSLLGGDTLTALSGSMFINFKTDGQNTSGGWSATYTSTISNSNNIIENINAIKIYPNPVNEKIIIETMDYKDTNIKLLNTKGQLLQCFDLDAFNTEININNYTNGIYILHIISSDKISTKKIIKE